MSEITAGTQHDTLIITGQLSLHRTLADSFIGGFAPAAGNSFDIFNWTSQTGTFSTATLPMLAAGFGWDTPQLYSTGVLSVASRDVPGDFNGKWMRHAFVGIAKRGTR